MKERPILMSAPMVSERPTPETEHVAWCRYITQEPRPTRIVLCDSNAPNAFRVYHEHDVLRLETERDEARAIIRDLLTVIDGDPDPGSAFTFDTVRRARAVIGGGK